MRHAQPLSPDHAPDGRPAVAPTRVGRTVTALAVAVLLAVAGLTSPPASGQGVQVHSPSPAPHAIVAPGVVALGAAASAGPVQVLVDGAAVEGPTTTDDLGRTLVETALEPGRHLIAITVGGAVHREWPIVVSPTRATSQSPDPLALARAASGPQPDRAVLLVNPDRPELSLATGPLGVATGAIVLPSAQGELPQRTREALADVLPDAGDVLVLGGLDAIGPEVVAQVEDLGHRVERIGTGSAADVAAAAVAHRPVADLYRRDGVAVPRPLLVAPAAPLDDAIQAAAIAAQRGAGLLLADGDGLTAETTRLLGGARLVWLAEGLDPQVSDEIRATAPRDAQVDTLPLDPRPGSDAWVADADNDPAAAILATRAATLDTPVLVQPDRTARWLGEEPAPHTATVVGDAADVARVQALVVDGPAAPEVSATLTGGSSPQVVLDVDAVPQAWSVHVEVHGREWPGTTTLEGSRLTWWAGTRPPLPPALEPTETTDAPLRVTAVVAANDAERHVGLVGTATIQPPRSVSGEGFEVAGGYSEVVGSGPLRTFTIEIEPATGLDLAAVTAEATSILLDAQRGWTARGARSMQRVPTPAEADIRVVVARPATVDAFCARVGLDTGGRLSCWDGRRAMLNLTRWNTGVSPFHTDLAVYRQYLVSHEVGHGLGYGHVSCPGSGALAPVMMQQSKGLGGCRVNGWPYPNG